ncbi:MAG TPA: hypothetical protein V6C52_06535 [Coleofasciculaceae cyanobacterium]|jgi:hypothetical protein
MICKLCGEDKTLCDAHIIPKWFYTEIQPKDGKKLLIIDPSLHYTPRSGKGEYDPNILCAECDGQIIGKWDDAAIKFFQNKDEWSIIQSEEDPKALAYEVKITDVDYAQLKLFFISLLWRASISQRPMFQAVQLGPFEQKAYEHIKNQNPGSEDEFSVIVRKFRPSEKPWYSSSKDVMHRSIISPIKKRRNQRDYYLFQLNEFSIDIKVSNKEIDPRLAIITLSRGRPFYIFERDFDESSEYKTLQIAIREQERKSVGFKNK